MSRRLLPALVLGVCAAALAAQPAPAQQASPRIIKGTPASITQYPYQVQIQNSGGTGICGGVVRDPMHVITAAHCVVNDPDGPLLDLFKPTPVANSERQVFYGSDDTNAGAFPPAAVARVDVMPQYLAADENYDAAMLTLVGALHGYGGATVNRIPFASAGELAAGIGQGQASVASGWGLTTDDGAPTNKLQAVSLPLRSDEACAAFFGGRFSPPLGVCAGGTGTEPANNPDTCNGDSGGPLALPTAGGLRLVGLTSFGDDDCGGTGEPAVYTETSNPEVCAFLGATTECNPPPPPAPAVRAVRDTTRPAARITSLRCRKRVCSFRVRTADSGGRVRSLSARVYRRVRVCRIRGGRRGCRTVLRNKKVRTKKIPRGYSGKTKLNVARYRLDAVATDTAGNRSKPARKRFKVKKR